MTDKSRVFYDGACPLCTAEIALYQRKADRERVEFVDVSQPNAELPTGLSQQRALARFHVQTAQGEVKSGAAGFVALWQDIPGWRWLARIAQVPGVTWVLERAYRLFLIARPSLVRLFVALTKRRT